MPGRLNGKRAVVTGSAGGIGGATVRRFLDEGAAVACADVERSMILTESETNAHQLKSYVVDVSERDAVERFVDDAAAWLGGIDIAVSCAGVRGSSPPLEITEGEWHRVLDINLDGTFFLAQAAGRHIRAAGGGAIVNISSTAAEQALGDQPHYAASKGAVRQLTKSLAVGLADFNIRVNAVGPGPIDTAMAAAEAADPERVAYLLERVLRRRYGRPDEVASAVLFLASDEADFITGTTLYVDGGLLATR